jgi:hypothetical protein
MIFLPAGKRGLSTVINRYKHAQNLAAYGKLLRPTASTTSLGVVRTPINLRQKLLGFGCIYVI